MTLLSINLIAFLAVATGEATPKAERNPWNRGSNDACPGWAEEHRLVSKRVALRIRNPIGGRHRSSYLRAIKVGSSDFDAKRPQLRSGTRHVPARSAARIKRIQEPEEVPEVDLAAGAGGIKVGGTDFDGTDKVSLMPPAPPAEEFIRRKLEGQMKRIPYQEGSVFVVPLRSGGFARGVVARCRPRGPVLVGYFFGPRLSSLADVSLEGLAPDSAVLVRRFGDPGLLNGAWPIVGTISGWDRSQWPMPTFARVDAHTSIKYLVRYTSDDPVKLESMTRTTDDISKLPEDGLSGWGALEVRLSMVLDGVA